MAANEAIVRGFNEEYINTGDRSRIAKFADEEIRMFCNGQCDAVGHDAYQEMLEGFRSAFPDFEHTTEELMTEGDRVAERFTTRGTHRGEFEGIPATGKKVEFTGTSIFTIRGGRVVEERTSVDLLALMQQLGVIPVPEEVSA